MASQQWQASYDRLSKRAVEILRLLAEGLSDREIAERLVMTINTVKWYNRQIYGILGVGSRTQAISRARDLQLLEQGDGVAIAAKMIPRTLTHKLPVETTTFIGRKVELETVRQRLETTRLLTLVGPPGTGKTRLSLHAAWEVAHTFRDGAYFVALAPIADPELVPHTIASAIGASIASDQPISEALQHVLRDSHLLLVLDNFEHLLPAAPLLSDLLAAAPQLRILVTSREPLHLYGEQQYAVPPLELPDPEQPDPQVLAHCESVALFVQQARAVRAAFELTPENAVDVANICVRLEGLPLAIELAAARIKILTPRALLARLRNRLDTLTGGAQDLPIRQRTLRNTIEWSHNLLNEGEKRLFARLAVFRGGCSLEAVEAVAGSGLPTDVFDALASLVDKSLLQQQETSLGEPRFVMLEMLHEYAWERLQESGELEAIQRAHAIYFVGFAERTQPLLRLEQQQYWGALLEMESDNMRLVLAWSLGSGDVLYGIRLASALYLLWYSFGFHREGYSWTESLLQRLPEVPLVYHAPFLICVGKMTLFTDLDRARQRFAQALDAARQVGAKHHAAWALNFLGYTMLGNTTAAMSAVEEGLALFRELDHKPGMEQALNIIGEIARFEGDDVRAKQAYEECLVFAYDTGNMRRVRFLLGNLAFIANHEGNYEQAKELAYQALELALDSNKLDKAESLAILASALSKGGQPRQAAVLFGGWQKVLEALGAVPQPADQIEFENCIAASKVLLGEEDFAAAWAVGRAMPLEQALTFALQLKSSIIAQQ